MPWSCPALLERRTRPPLVVGVLVMVACVAAETVVAGLLASITPVHALDLVFLAGIVVVASLWGLGPGMAAALTSAVAYDALVTTPLGVLRLDASEFWAALTLFTAVSLLACALASLCRSLNRELEARADATASTDVARILLGAPTVTTAMPSVARRLAHALGLSSASITSGAVPSTAGQEHFILRDDGAFATLRVPAGLSGTTLERLRERIVPSLELSLRSARDRERAAEALRAGNEELTRVVEEQRALRRLATLVARNVEPSEIFDAVARTMGQVLGMRHSVIVRYEPGGTKVTTVGGWNYEGIVGRDSRWAFADDTVSGLVFRTRAPARVDRYRGDSELAKRLRERGVVSSVGCPIMVGRHLWGVAMVSSTTTDPLPPGIEERMKGFVELAGTAIANAQSLSDLHASRARVVAAADETRRRIERDLHDGTQQRLVSVLLTMRAKENELPPGLRFRRWLHDTADALDDTVAELQKISRGLHPSILTRRGLASALAALADRSPVPVRLNVSAEHPLPEPIQITIYYVVSESLTNTAKHACATTVHIELTTTESLVRLRIHDDGRGGADPGGGSGLTGLIDRVNALGGGLAITSEPGNGTTISVRIPTRPTATQRTP